MVSAMKKKVLIAGSAFVVLLAGLGVGGYQWLLGRFDKDAVIAQMEASWSCRAQLDSTQVKILSSPARLELHGLKLAPKDDQSALPASQRQALSPEKVLLSTELAVLEVELKDLVDGKINVKELHIGGVSVKTEVDEDGRSSLQALFKSPGAVDAPKAPATPTEQAVTGDAGTTTAKGVQVTELKTEPATKPEATTKEAKPKSVFRASDMKVAVRVDEASLERGSVEITNQKNASKIQLSDVNLKLKEIDVNAADLAAHNHCGFELAGGIRVENLEKKQQVADIKVNSKGTMEPFDVSTGEWMPDLNLEVTLAKGSLLGGMDLGDQLKKKDREKVAEYGLNLEGVLLGGALLEDAFVKVHQVRGKVIMKGETRLVFPQYEIILNDGSWVNASQDLHNVKARLVLNADLTAKKLEEVKKTLSERFGKDITEALFPLAVGTLIDSQNRLSLPFKSKGSLAKPDFGFDNIFGDLKDMVKDSAAGFLKGLLEK
ncbi:hypothetical protein [Verrucomicrobium sp. BvORR034]|uniref:hypothetical protein n=1 Tax=Verrucomicrobium sp. BvORR034 TaxID=1396418 RepID=UPI000678F315|nr:hypothetical protein [Verrucomicrobium sp. BvORR034]